MDRFFQLSKRGTTVGREVRGAVATFLTMSYILVANPAILSAAGIPFEAAVAGTALAAGVCSILMGLGANFPIALAPGMGLNALVAFQVVEVTGSWRPAMGLIVLDGLVILLLVLAGLREAVMNAIPVDLRRAIAVGIGLFIAFIGAVNARLVIVPAGTVFTLSRDPLAILPPVTFGPLQSADAMVAFVGLIVIAVLLARGVKGALILGIAISTALALLLDVAKMPAGSWLRLPQFDTLFQADVTAAMRLAFVPLLLSIVMVDFFDTIGTVTAIGEAADLKTEDGQVPGCRRILAIDSISASIGGLFGVSSVTSYIESAAGVSDGARTGLHSVVVGVLFLIAVFAAPVAAIVPGAATAPALILVGFLMCQQIARIDFEQLDTAIPAFLTIALISFTYSISHGIGYGFIAFAAIKVLRGRFGEVHPLMYATSASFLAYFVLA
jgi:AGZA family xanthine/uracil permease-like MFS transporter